MQTTALGFLVFSITRSPVYLGYVAFAAGIPTWLFALAGGVAADRMRRRTLMIITQSAMMVLATILAALTFAGVVEPWHIMVLAFLLGTANAFDAPARLAFVGEMVPRADMTNAIALNATMFNIATAAGPAVAGVAYALFGPGWCFAINAASFLAVIAALSMMDLPAAPRQPRTTAALAELREGVQYVARNRLVRTLIVLMAATSLLGISFTSLVPAWTVNILNGDAAMNGILYAARGIGSLAGALFIASLGTYAHRGRLLLGGAITFPLFFFIFAEVRWVPLALLMLVGVGMGTILVLNLCNALVQTITPDRLRGRVMGTYSMIFFGFMPLGSLWTGFTAEHLGEPAAVVINAGIMLAVALGVTLFMPDLRNLEGFPAE
jgi:MFS family permease